jgi:hypothetical protein
MSIEHSHRVDPTQAGAEERVGLVISGTLIVSAVLALVGVVLPGSWGTGLATAALVLVTAIPIVRVGWLVKRWAGQRDTKFVWAAVVLLALVAVGPIIALLQR